MTRYLSGIRRQVQDVCDLFSARYGHNSNIAELAVKTLVSATLLEHELTILDQSEKPTLMLEADETESLAAVSYTGGK